MNFMDLFNKTRRHRANFQALKQLGVVIALLMAVIPAHAYDFKVDGIYYNINPGDSTVTVTYESTCYDSYCGDILIPSMVIFDATSYTVTDIGEYAFGMCYSLTSVEIPNSVTSIGSSSFQYCTSLQSVEIPNSVTYISDYAFSNCYSLQDVVIPYSVTYIGQRAFQLAKFKYLKIPNSVTYIGDSAFSGSSLQSVEIPNSVTYLGEYAFFSCSSLQSVEILNSITSIGDYTFGWCRSLQSVEIPNSVTYIGDYAFRDCTALKTLYSFAAVPPTCDSNAFDGVNKEECVLYVPEGSVEAYKAADQWKDFLYIEGTSAISDVVADGDMDVTYAVGDGALTIGGAEGKAVSVYGIDGSLRANYASYHGGAISLPQGVYVVKVAGLPARKIRL